jgi:PAS domain-containing protein
MKGLELGAVDYIAKPISPPIVLARVETHLKLKTSADFLRDKAEFLEQEAIWTQLAMEVGQVVFWQVDLTDESITYLGNPSEIENSSLPDKQGSVNVASPLGPIRMGLSERLSVLDPQEAIRINELIHQAAKTGEPFEFVYRILNDGDECVERWIASRAKPILSVSGGPVSIIMGASMDITDLRRAQEDAKSAREEARQAHAARKELLARMTQDSRKFL